MVKFRDIKYKQLNIEEVKILVKWAEEEGWNPGPNDAEVYYSTDPDGFLGCYLEGELIGGGSIVSYNGKFGFMGFFIVKPEFRSKGIGEKLWYKRRDLLLSRLEPGASIGMDGVVDMQPFYKKGGFNIAFRDIRYERIGSSFAVNENISSIEENDFREILEYDKKCFGFERTKFLKNWLKLPDNKTFKFVENNILKGLAIVRKANSGYKICPLFADNDFIAEELYKACLNSVKDEALYLDIPETNKGAKNIIEKYKGNYVFECARMYYGKEPKYDKDKIYGVTTFELG